jgi:hypothetical protein
VLKDPAVLATILSFTTGQSVDETALAAR